MRIVLDFPGKNGGIFDKLIYQEGLVTQGAGGYFTEGFKFKTVRLT